MSQPDPLIEVHQVERRYARPHARGRVPRASRGFFDVLPGQRLGIVGESGSGKSTLVRMLAALDQPTAGSISFRGRRVNGVPERKLGVRSEVQTVFQDPRGSLDPRMRVRDIISEPLGRAAGRLERVTELLAAVGRQCVSLAPRPSVLVADEPVSVLDVPVRAQILNLLADLVERFQLTLVFVSDDLGVVRRVCDTVAVMRHGGIVELGTVGQIYDAPKHEYTRELIGAVPNLRAALAKLTEGG